MNADLLKSDGRRRCARNLRRRTVMQGMNRCGVFVLQVAVILQHRREENDVVGRSDARDWQRRRNFRGRADRPCPAEHRCHRRYGRRWAMRIGSLNVRLHITSGASPCAAGIPARGQEAAQQHRDKAQPAGRRGGEPGNRPKSVRLWVTNASITLLSHCNNGLRNRRPVRGNLASNPWRADNCQFIKDNPGNA